MVHLIELNPFFRHSAGECLQNPIFDDIRIEFNESSAPTKLKLDVDTDEAFDYSSGKSLMYSTEDYIGMIDSEVEYFEAMRQNTLQKYFKA